MIVSIDIGSTWTKGAVFELKADELVLKKRVNAPTTVSNLEEGFSQVFKGLVSNPYKKLLANELDLFYSSSAKGGLAVAALGIVPEITLDMAKMAAASAGAKLASVFSYHLTRSDISRLEKNPPDILLFAGGTDGGNCDYVLANAQALAQSTLSCSMIYAGNRSVEYEVAECLSDKDLICVENLLPNLSSPNPEPTRAAIRKIFLSKIVKGKGLDQIIDKTQVEPLPTPYAVFEFVQQIRHHVKGWDDFILLDLGGATTDVYSAHEEVTDAATVFRGIPEEVCKRTVEGDLGMRVSAESAAETTKDLLTDALSANSDLQQQFSAFVTDVTQQPDTLPIDSQGKKFDQLLAGACIAHACERHAGRKHEVWTVDGMVDLQVGRDLSSVTRVIGSGGYLSKVADFNPEPWLAKKRIDDKGKRVLLPASIDYFRDESYLFPLLANVAQGYPKQAAHMGIRCLTSASFDDGKVYNVM